MPLEALTPPPLEWLLEVEGVGVPPAREEAGAGEGCEEGGGGVGHAPPVQPNA